MQYAVETFAITKRFPKNSGWQGLLNRGEYAAPAVEQVSLQIRSGELFGLLGPNGAGKTTLIKMLSTLIEPTSGLARVNGFELRQDTDIRASIGLVTSDERSFYWRLSGRQNLLFFSNLYNIPREKIGEQVNQVLEQVALQEFADKRFMTYSTGMRQRLSIARALLNQPQLLILDEPTKGLDPFATRSLHSLVRDELVEQRGMTVLLTTHDLQEAEQMCDRIAIMNHGKVRAVGTQAELGRDLDLGRRTVLQVAALPFSTRARLERLFEPEQIQITDSTPVHSDQPEAIVNAFDIQLSPGDGSAALNAAIDLLRGDQVEILSVCNRLTSLEEVFSYHAGLQPPAEKVLLQPDLVSEIDLPERQTASGIGKMPAAPTFWRVMPAFIKRDLIRETSYRLSFLLQFIGIFFSVLIFYFISELLGDAAAPYLKDFGGDYFSFVLIGIAFLGYFSTGLTSFSNNLRNSQTTGSLEAMLTTPTSLSAIILASSLWDYFVTTLRVLVYLSVGIFLLNVDFGGGNYWAALLIILLTVINASSLGIISASFVMVVKRGDPINWSISTLTALLGGVYYPVSILPPPLEWLSRLLPITYALNAMRKALLQGATWNELTDDLLALCLFAGLLLPLSLFAFRYAVHRAKVEGTLTHY